MKHSILKIACPILLLVFMPFGCGSEKSQTTQPKTYTLTVTIGAHGKVDPTGGTYNEGTVVNLTATPDTGYRISSWKGTDNDNSIQSTNTVTMTASKTVEVAFALVLTVYAGKAMTVDNGGKVFLVGLPSNGSGNITYAWTQKSGPAISLQNAQGQIVEFTAPQVTSDTEIKIQLTVTDAISQTATAEIAITIWPHATHGPTFTEDDAAIEDIYGDAMVWPGSLTPLGSPGPFIIEDLNGDGFKDVIYAGLTSYQDMTSLPNPTPKAPIRVLLNNGNRTMSDRTNVFLDGSSGLEHAKTGFAADFNGDGRMDVVFCGQGQEYYVPNGIQGEPAVLLMGQSNGTLKNMSSTFNEGKAGFFHWMAVGDVNGDQKPDMVFVDINNQGGNGKVVLFFNNGDGTFNRRQDLLPSNVLSVSYNFFSTALIDMNNDNVADLLLGHERYDSLLLISDGAGNFKSHPSVILPQVQAYPTVLYISDFDLNGDNFKDLIVTRTNAVTGRYKGRYMQVLVNDRNGGFIDVSAQCFPDQDLNSDWADKGYVCDIDGDGDLDYIIERIPADSTDRPQQSIFVNNGAGVFEAYPQPPLPGVRACMMPIDIDNDHIIELLSVHGDRDSSTNPWRDVHRWVLLNNTTPRH